MQIIAAFGGSLFILSSLIVGGRLMWLAKQTRGLPELTLGAGLFFMGGVGYPLMMIAILATGLSHGTRIALLATNMAATTGGMAGLAWFTRRVFRPQETWATVLMFAIVAGYTVLALVQALGPGILSYLEAPDRGSWSNSPMFGTIAMTWSGLEALRYYGLQRKRLTLGLADPVVTDRFLLWAIAILASDLVTLVSMVLKGIGIPVAASAVGSLLVGTLGLVTSGAFWLAFVPPASYVERVRQRAVAIGLRTRGSSSTSA